MQRRDPDTLTPREQQVLDLLKRGYSNRDIASELQISLAGAKYHVSEIISKLGVSSREEAAEIRVRSRQWVLAPLWLGSMRLYLPQLVGLKLAFLALVVGGIGIGGLLLAGWSQGDSGNPSPEPGGAFDPCGGRPGCFVAREIEYETIEAAAVHASFQPMMPAYIPDGFTQHQVFAKERDYSNPYVPEVHNDWVTVTYRNDEGSQLVISQGFGGLISARYAFPPEAKRGTLETNGRQALWSTSVPLTVVFHPETDLALAVTLYLGRFGSGWGQEGSWFSGSPMEYTIAGDSLSLDELISIAESVTFPDILAPNEGYAPEPYFD
jgi:DNA-binding CsgD family transcriptional regulator